MGRGPETARDELARAKQSLAEAKRQLKAAQERERKAAGRRAAHWLLKADNSLGRATLILYDLGEYRADAAVAFVLSAAARRRWEPRPEAEVRSLVSDLFLEVDPDSYAGLCDVANPTDEDAMRAALRFWEEWSLTAFTKDANRRKGVAPSADTLLQRLEERRLRLPEAVRPPSWGSVAHAGARMRLTRWRRRWNGRHGKIRTRDDIPVQEMRDKAALCFNATCQRWGGCSRANLWVGLRSHRRLVRANFESGFRTQIWDEFRTPPFILKGKPSLGGPILRPESGLKIGPGKRQSESEIRHPNKPGSESFFWRFLRFLMLGRHLTRRPQCGSGTTSSRARRPQDSSFCALIWTRHP